MEEHIARREEALRKAKAIIAKSDDVSEELLRKILIHQELLSNKDIILNDDFYSILNSRISVHPEMVELISRKERVECVRMERKLICPISQKEVVDPYIGECGHALEKKEAMKYIRSNPRAVCPQIGCNKILVKKKR
ncbi:DNA repair protein Mms21 [Encephalitozoon hellem ATCC 50504]|uniref:DNA repair protein Mms21 n=1 Tax=Encephalitozoon hellem TaxID=27973 RepID=A0A9Q9FCA5_ENCHE|nr:DNA repair protein Mms21 [Encephalitozoon hellem ATCC 50504]AFM99032.1 DNA repair protein Mms21 [Encephalitozoon hellem ATCC 50504]UTX44050.1 hypothetical protein GPU96_09g18310 [Encephalitozoon hellem]WEL39533.1 DNA repair protein Mms21 [Encephalitozoon hellem]|eukprot:XP_003888013.1 DNA repair protein Mms21 [Encephalitozoon hellem ATCC 50504]